MEGIIITMLLRLVWIIQLANAQIPVRSYQDVITGHDPRLQLDNTSLCEGYSDERGIDFQRLLLQDNTVYIGATNHIFQVEVPSFDLSKVAVLGPYDDDAECIAPPICTAGCGSLRCTDNRIRLLLAHRDQLIACGNIYAGTCNLLNISDVSQAYKPAPDIKRLKCDSDSQIARHTGDIGVASIFVHGQEVKKDLLYVGAGGPVETFFPPDSGLSYPKLNFKKIDDTSKYSKAELGKQDFIASWTTDTHNFMLWNNISENQGIISRLCHSTLNDFERGELVPDEVYGQSTYTQSEVSCDGYNKAILGYYRFAKLYVLFDNGNRHALCSVTVNSINDHFLDARRSCFAGELDKADHIYKDCKKITVPYSEMLTCGYEQAFTAFVNPVRCKQKLNFKVEFTWPDGAAPPTMVAVDLVNGFTTGFFGMSSGEIKKARLGDEPSRFSEGIMLEEGSPVLHDVGFDSTKQFMYAMTSNKLYKVKLSNCDQYTTCGECVTSNDAYCGWCVLQSRCTQRSECEQSSSNWMKISVPGSQCPHVADVQPNALSVAQSQELSLTFGGNPLPSFEYECEFAVAGQVLSASRLVTRENVPVCHSPPTPPDIPQGEDNVNVSLRIKAGTAIVATGSFNIYNCSKIPGISSRTMCSSCVTSSWGCNWCLASKTCEDNCINADETPSRKDCPRVDYVENNRVDVPVKKPKEFVLMTTNLPELDLTCVLDVCDSASTVEVPGIRQDDKVICSVDNDLLKCPKEDSTVSVLLHAGRYIVDTPRIKTVSVGLFNCSREVAECGLCILSHDKHDDCSWCDAQQSCVLQVDCPEGGVTNISSCPRPLIESIEPLTGPVDGGTKISLVGKNLGSRPEEIDRIMVAGGTGEGREVKCQMLPDEYLPSKKIVCRTNASSQDLASGLVRVKTTYAVDVVISNQAFTFKTVRAESFSPEHALEGTKITINGANLNVGNSGKVSISKDGESLEYASECGDRTSDRLVCLLPNVPTTGKYHVSVIVDGFEKKMDDVIEFVTSPNITFLIGRNVLKSFYSGGLKVTFQMTSLLGIQRVVIEVNNGEKSADCVLDRNTTTVTCPIPSLPKPENRNRFKRNVATDKKSKVASSRAAPTPVPAAIIINDEVRIPLSGDDLSLSYVPDPIIEPLTLLPCRSDSKVPQSRQNDLPPGNDTELLAKLTEYSGPSESKTAIQLTGANLDYAAVREDYDVKIVPLDASESINCEPSYLESGSLICKAPSTILSKYEGYKVQVTVKVGNLSFTLPAVQYCPDATGFSVLAIAVTVTIVVVLVVIIFGLILCNRQRAQKQQKEREQIMLMLDTLENKTRENARKAYFELQAGYMTTLTDNLSDSITYLPPVSCFMRALFNDWDPAHPIVNTKTTAGMSSTRISGLDGFIQLLKNQDFLVTLIRTLEEQKHFTVKEKGQFASLLTVVLFDDLVYFTRVMLDLLSELIQKHVSKNPKLLLRRSESVVEKMVSHWLCVNLYSQCILEQAGKPLFLLTKAIHFLVNSAPSDVVANKAVNSLNEMTLLGSEVTYEVITLRASVMENGQKSDSFEVKVVNCDTISQVKDKIIEVFYRDRPFSECPKPDEMELEFVAGQGHLVLSDVDNMCHEEGNYTQINTLKHYNVRDGANVLLSPVHPRLEVATENGNSSPTAPRKRRLYHLIHPRDKEVNGFIEEDDATGGNKTKAIIGNLINRPFQEIYLTRMVKSKTTVQEYVDGVFNAILSPTPISRAIKYFFQFLDKEAAKHKISDPEVVHIWKTNSLLLRYWVNVLKNPEFIFDINKTMIVDNCLNVITQAFMDACTTTNRKLGQDSPSNKLLYAKDAERYREMVSKFFDSISKEQVTPDEEMNQSLCRVSKEYGEEFNRRAAAEQLYSHLEKYKSQVQAALSDENPDMCSRLDEIIRKLSPDSNGHSHDPIDV